MKTEKTCSAIPHLKKFIQKTVAKLKLENKLQTDESSEVKHEIISHRPKYSVDGDVITAEHCCALKKHKYSMYKYIIECEPISVYHFYRGMIINECQTTQTPVENHNWTGVKP